MNYVYIGEIVNTHGIKGELRIISEFPYKDKVFFHGMKLYLGKRKQLMVINSYRVHKNFDMVTFEGINDINEAIIFKSDEVYVDRNDLIIDGFIKEDLIGLSVYNNDKSIGTLTNIVHNKVQDILLINDLEKCHMIPWVDEFVKNIDLKNSRIDIEVIEGLLNED